MIFGTDGIRGEAGVPPLDRITVCKISAVLAQWLPQDALVVIGSDTRTSREEIRTWLVSALGATRVLDLGIVPTPVVAFETRARNADLGIMITASHNPPKDNGLKFFERSGLKLPKDVARRWSDQIGTIQAIDAPASLTAASPDHYRAFIKETFDRDRLQGIRFGFDLANGAGSLLVPDLLEELGIRATFIGNTADGSRINDGVGALHPEALADLLTREQLPYGFALDGDGDRLAAAAPQALNGDVVIYALYRILREKKPVPAVVGTIMCGMGLENRLREEGVELIRTPVGDQNVLAEQIEKSLPLGGEPSGHLILSDLFPAGDGLLAALTLATGLADNPALLREAVDAVPMLPTYEQAYRVRHKPPLDEVPAVAACIASLEERIAGTGRIIIRYSGTEPKLRFYLEAPDPSVFDDEIRALEAAIQEQLV